VGWKNGKRSVARQDVSSLGSHKPLARSEDLIVEELGDEVLVYDSNSDTAHCLSPDAASVWRRCDGQMSIDALTAEVGLSAERVEGALAELERCDLLAERPTPVGHTRRDLSLKTVKVAAAAAAAPLIISVAAPTPAQAVTRAFCAQFSSGNCGMETSGGCSGSVGCCCCTPTLTSPFPPGTPCAELETSDNQCKTCVPCDDQPASCLAGGHKGGTTCGNESGCPAA
jgi:hypothetical protein